MGLATKGLGKSFQVASKATGVVGDVPAAARSLDRIWGSIRNIFRIGSKVYDEGAGTLKLTSGSTLWKFEHTAGEVTGRIIKYAPTEEITVLRVVRADFDPLAFGKSAGRVNSEGTSRLYTVILDGSVDESTAIQTAIREAKGLQIGDAYKVYKFKVRPSEVVDIGGMSVTEDVTVRAIRESLGDTVNKSLAQLGGVRYTSVENQAVTNLMLKDPKQLVSGSLEEIAADILR